jgi:hypothetical protein
LARNRHNVLPVTALRLTVYTAPLSRG